MLPEEIKRFIGKTGNEIIMEVEKGAIRRYADAVGDFNPIYWDEEYAAKSRYGSIIAPPGFFGWPSRWSDWGPNYTSLREELAPVLAKAGYTRALDGGIEYEFFSPVRAGDVLRALPKIVDVYERESKTGTLLFTVTEITYTRRSGELAARARSTLIYR